MNYATIFGVNYHLLICGIVATLLIWSMGNRYLSRKLWRSVNQLGCTAALFLILWFTVLRRTPSDSHILVFALPESRDYIREMVMNAVLFFPLGLCLSVLIGPWSVAVAFALSLSIETWQYFSGSGIAQGTDLIMNVLGVILGSIPCFFRGEK